LCVLELLHPLPAPSRCSRANLSSRIGYGTISRARSSRGVASFPLGFVSLLCCPVSLGADLTIRSHDWWYDPWVATFVREIRFIRPINAKRSFCCTSRRRIPKRSRGCHGIPRSGVCCYASFVTHRANDRPTCHSLSPVLTSACTRVRSGTTHHSHRRQRSLVIVAFDTEFRLVSTSFDRASFIVGIASASSQRNVEERLLIIG